MCQKNFQEELKNLPSGDKSDSPGSATSRDQEYFKLHKNNQWIRSRNWFILAFFGPDLIPAHFVTNWSWFCRWNFQKSGKIYPKTRLDNSGLARKFLGKQGQNQHIFLRCLCDPTSTNLYGTGWGGNREVQVLGCKSNLFVIIPSDGKKKNL